MCEQYGVARLCPTGNGARIKAVELFAVSMQSDILRSGGPMITDVYIQKSFVLLGSSLPHCFRCAYCRVADLPPISMTTLPGSVNARFRALPVAVNLFHGDPTLQSCKTLDVVNRLLDAGHVGPIVIITKGDVDKLDGLRHASNVIIGFSTFGCESRYTGRSLASFEQNLRRAHGSGLHYYIEYRPIIRDINDSNECFRYVIGLAAQYGIPVAYSGLLATQEMLHSWRANGFSPQPWDGMQIGKKKVIEATREAALRAIAANANVPVFRKTSCAVSYMTGMPRDYNAHYYRPHEVGCNSCVMRQACMQYHQRGQPSILDLPYAHEVRYKTDHVCSLVRNGLCETPHPDCSRIAGSIVVTSQQLTTADVRVTKWLTGLTVDAPFIESPYLSDFWQC